jgi:hypothetical protein
VSRIFLVLVVLAIVLVCVAGGLGLYVGPYNELYMALMHAEEELRVLSPQASPVVRQRLERQVDQVFDELSAPRRRATVHMLFGILASLVAVLVNSISVTYFIGTSRWCKEVVETYQLDENLAASSARLKRRSFPWTLGGLLAVLAIVAFGAAADPGTLRQSTGDWVLPHFTAALAGGSFIAVSFLAQADLIRRNSDIVERILSHVREVRLQRGLDVE